MSEYEAFKYLQESKEDVKKDVIKRRNEQFIQKEQQRRIARLRKQRIKFLFVIFFVLLFLLYHLCKIYL